MKHIMDTKQLIECCIDSSDSSTEHGGWCVVQFFIVITAPTMPPILLHKENIVQRKTSTEAMLDRSEIHKRGWRGRGWLVGTQPVLIKNISLHVARCTANVS